MPTRENMNLKFFAVLLSISLLASASYLIQLKYEQGVVTQEEVYDVDSTPDTGAGGYEISVGSYNTNFSFPLILVSDSPGFFDANGTQVLKPDADQVVKEETSGEAFIVVPEVPDGTILSISNGTHTLLNEPLKQAKQITQGSSQTPPSTPTTSICPAFGAILAFLAAGCIVQRQKHHDILPNSH